MTITSFGAVAGLIFFQPACSAYRLKSDSQFVVRVEQDTVQALKIVARACLGGVLSIECLF
jgi:hypothetical protein